MSGVNAIEIYPPPQPANQPLPVSARWRRRRATVLGLLGVFAALVVAGALVEHPLRVLQPEMQNTLQPGQYVFTDPIIPALFGYGRGDVVMVRLPGEPPDGAAFAYRVIGLPGDTIDLRGGYVLVNGHQLREPYVYDHQPTEPEPETGPTHWVVPARTLFVLGDRRESTADSRVYGPIPLADVVGRAWLRCWPPNSLGFISVP